MIVLEEGARSPYLSRSSLAADLPLEVWDRILVEALVCPDWDGVYADQYRGLVQVIRPSLFVLARHSPSSVGVDLLLLLLHAPAHLRHCVSLT